MLSNQPVNEKLLQRVNNLSRELERLKGDLLRSIAVTPTKAQAKPSLFGSLASHDIPPDEIERSQRSLFRSLDDL